MQDLLPDAFVFPFAKVIIDGLPGRKLVRQHAPGTSTAQDVEDGIHDFAPLMDVVGGL
jgi:hypothetical protein